MNEIKKEALKMFLEYIFEENGKTTEVETIVETYVDKKLKDYFDVVANKIDAINDETKKLKKDFIKVHEKSVDAAPEIVRDVQKSENKIKESKTHKTSPEKTMAEQIIDIVPEYTSQEIKKISRELKKKYNKHMKSSEKDDLLRNYVTTPQLAKLMNMPRQNVNAQINKLIKDGSIQRFKVDESYLRSPVIFYKKKEEPILERSIDAEYNFSQTYKNPGFELINNKYIKTKHGKQFPITAHQLKELCELTNGRMLTNKLFLKCGMYLTNVGVNPSEHEQIIYHLSKGHLNMILTKYTNYLKKHYNAHFEVYDGTLLVNGKDTKLTVKEVKKMITDYPYGFSDKKIEEYTKACIEKYTFCPAECIRVILSNHDDYTLKHVLKKKEKFVENNPQKRRSLGII